MTVKLSCISLIDSSLHYRINIFVLLAHHYWLSLAEWEVTSSKLRGQHQSSHLMVYSFVRKTFRKMLLTLKYIMFLILLDIANGLVEEGIHEDPVFNELSYFLELYFMNSTIILMWRSIMGITINITRFVRALMINTNEDTYKASVKANDVENLN